MKKIRIDSFNPKEGPVGTQIDVMLTPSSAPQEPANSLYAFGGTFTPLSHGGPPISSPEVEIIDNTRYTAFSIQVPHDLKEDEIYSFSIILFPVTEGESKESYSIDSGGEGFLVSAKPGLPDITLINPRSLKLTSLTRTNILIHGTNLDKLDRRSPAMILSQPQILLRYINLDKDIGTLKASVVSPEVVVGNYTIKFNTLDNRTVLSKTKINLL